MRRAEQVDDALWEMLANNERVTTDINDALELANYLRRVRPGDAIESVCEILESARASNRNQGEACRELKRYLEAHYQGMRKGRA